jgi:polyisoprenoid-binding protein YceI
MKKSSLIKNSAVLFVTAMLGTGFHAFAAPSKSISTSAQSASVYKVLPEQSDVKWIGKKVTGSHHGTIQLKSGELMVANGAVVGGKFTIDMTSIKDLDLTDPEYNGKLIGHLKSDEFFGVEKFPTSTFDIAKVTPISNAKAGEPNNTIEGNLTIKGITQPVSFPATIEVTNDTVMAAAKEIKVDRTLYNIRYGSKKFFASIGDKAINDEFLISVSLTAKK